MKNSAVLLSRCITANNERVSLFNPLSVYVRHVR